MLKKYWLTALILLAVGAAVAAEPPTSLKVTIPDYKLVKYGTLDHIELPEGRLLITEERRPEIPYYLSITGYPSGYRIQAVTMKSRTGEETRTGVKLPPVLLDTAQVGTPTLKQGLYPTRDFDWQASRNRDGSSQLAIAIYPFFYDPKTTDLKAYKDYEFEVRYVKTTVSISDVSTDKQVYDPGETVKVRTRLNNTGKPQPAVVAATVVKGFAGTHVADLPAKKLDALGRSDSVTMDWPSTGIPAGDYDLKVAVKDTAGTELDEGRTTFRIGNPQCEVTSLTAVPQQFKVGDAVKLALEVKNTGTLELAGQAVFEVRSPDSTVRTVVKDFQGLAPGKTRQFSDDWNTRGAVKGVRYEILGYVAYAGLTSLPKRLTVSTNAAPTATFTFAPEEPAVDKEVSFDASGSSDADGHVAEYAWDFGDGGAATGKTATHAFSLPGDYQVTLTVKDNEGAETSAAKTVTVGK